MENSGGHNDSQRELERLREEHRQVSDLLALIQELTGLAIRTDTSADLFAASFRTLHRCVKYDVGIAVMFEQTLDLYIATREGAQALVSDELIDAIRRTLRGLVPAGLASADVIVKAERNDLPSAEIGDALANVTHATLQQEHRTAGMLILFRGAPEFRDTERQIVEICATQVSMLLGNLRARNEIVSLADTDDLTGIWNKRFFRRQLPQEIERARVYNIPLSLLIFDVDNFKQINDSFGHTIGDVVLSELCGAVRETLRPPDLFARFGGDEFSVILPHTDLSGACAVAERILRKVESLTIPTDEEGAIQCSISIGVADFRLEDPGMTEFVRRADERLYLSKRQGKNRYTA